MKLDILIEGHEHRSAKCKHHNPVASIYGVIFLPNFCTIQFKAYL